MGAWNIAQLLLWLIVAQQGLACLLWILAQRVRIAPRVPALHWAGAAAWTLVTMLLVLQASRWHPQAAHVLSNLLSPGIFLLMAIGLEINYRLPRRDAEHLLVIVLALLCGLAGQWFEAPPAWPVAYSSVLNAWVLWRCQRCIARPARQEVGGDAALLIVLPLSALTLLFALRALAALVLPEQAGVPLSQVTPANVAALAVFLTASVVIHLMLAMAVTLRLLARLQSMARRDPLTGLLNRRGLAEQWPPAGATYSLLVLDVDFFKRVNDERGHSVGDLALQHLAELLRRSLRSGDAAARFGGEEFVVLLRGQNLLAAAAAAERLRTDIASRPLRLGEQALALTVSIGVAQATGSDDADALIARADRALYRAKALGRNRVELEESR